MPDDLTQTGNQDDVRVKVNQDHEVAYRSRTLKVTPEHLRELVAKVGPMVADVKRAVARA